MLLFEDIRRTSVHEQNSTFWLKISERSPDKTLNQNILLSIPMFYIKIQKGRRKQIRYYEVKSRIESNLIEIESKPNQCRIEFRKTAESATIIATMGILANKSEQGELTLILSRREDDLPNCHASENLQY
jgi:hypothetical protein